LTFAPVLRDDNAHSGRGARDDHLQKKLHLIRYQCKSRAEYISELFHFNISHIGFDKIIVYPYGETKNQPAAGGDNAREPENPDGGSGQRETVRVTITEGMTLTQIFKKLEANGVCSFNDLMKTAESYDYSYYPLIAARPANTRAFKLEGYLFPNTYDFYKNEKPQDAIGRFLRISEKYITSQDRAKAKSMGYSMDQVLTVADDNRKRGREPQRSQKDSRRHIQPPQGGYAAADGFGHLLYRTQRQTLYLRRRQPLQQPV